LRRFGSKKAMDGEPIKKLLFEELARIWEVKIVGREIYSIVEFTC
jgi:hypothetical protein